MTEYTVLPATDVEDTSLPRNEFITVHKKALQDLTDIVEAFSRAHSGQVTILDGVWLNPELKIETTPELAKELSSVPGIGSVSVYEPEKLERESQAKKPPQGPRF